MNSFWKNLAFILTLIGGLNWGLVGAFNFDLVAFLFGPMSVLSRIVYIVVGLAALAMVFAPSCSLKEATDTKTK